MRLTKDAVFGERRTCPVRVRRFTLPAVKEGSVIEFRYLIESDFFHEFREWHFQQEIPVRWSKYNFNMVPGIEYRILFQEFEQLAVDKTQRTPGGIKYQWAMKNVPALREEPYMSSPENYHSRVWFELVRRLLTVTDAQPAD
ncbi:DUF3857 domain-containing protein [Larkinella soli]|uniref:DUF3857 domain-containing protein n=1 Tax=Larkinella soli TaxID=1770527 RepID=UPI000FFC9071|nr:DUF3857 domain-containing protein [Larkinella soli]